MTRNRSKIDFGGGFGSEHENIRLSVSNALHAVCMAFAALRGGEGGR
jgi:hypothetical protein